MLKAFSDRRLLVYALQTEASLSGIAAGKSRVELLDALYQLKT